MEKLSWNFGKDASEWYMKILIWEITTIANMKVEFNWIFYCTKGNVCYIVGERW